MKTKQFYIQVLKARRAYLAKMVFLVQLALQELQDLKEKEALKDHVDLQAQVEKLAPLARLDLKAK